MCCSRCNHLPRKQLLVLVLVSAMPFPAVASPGSQKMRVYPAPEGIELSSVFELAVEEQQVPVYKTKVPPGLV